MNIKEEIYQYLTENRQKLEDLSAYIYANPELAYKEYKCSKALVDFLSGYDFKIETGVGGLETAFIATACPSGVAYPQIDILAEFDALDLGDAFGEKYKVCQACGHNIIATTACGAGVAMLEAMKKHNIEGTLRVVGTPAEESGGGKIDLLNAGIFEKTDVSFALHPTSGVSKIAGKCKSSASIRATYLGKGAHAEAHPEDGINAMDAAIVAYTAVGLLRNQSPSDMTIFCELVNNSDSRCVIPDKQEIVISMSCIKDPELDVIIPKVENIVKAGALATGCTVNYETNRSYQGRLPYESLGRVMRKNFELLGEPLMDGLVDDNGGEDFGNITRVLPGIQPFPSIYLDHKISNHTPMFCDCAGSERAKDVLILGSAVMADTCLDIYEDHSIIDEAKAELEKMKTLKM